MSAGAMAVLMMCRWNRNRYTYEDFKNDQWFSELKHKLHDERGRRVIDVDQFTNIDTTPSTYRDQPQVRFAVPPDIQATLTPHDGTEISQIPDRVEFEYATFNRHIQGIRLWIPVNVSRCLECRQSIIEGYWHVIQWTRFIQRGHEEEEGFTYEY